MVLRKRKSESCWFTCVEILSKWRRSRFSAHQYTLQSTNTSFVRVREPPMEQVLVGKFLAYMKVFSYIFSIVKSSVKAGLVLSMRQFSNYTVTVIQDSQDWGKPVTGMSGGVEWTRMNCFSSMRGERASRRLLNVNFDWHIKRIERLFNCFGIKMIISSFIFVYFFLYYFLFARILGWLVFKFLRTFDRNSWFWNENDGYFIFWKTFEGNSSKGTWFS